MKTTRITLLSALLFFAASCKKDNVKPVTTVENASLSLASGSQVISMPPGLEKASDLHAEYVVDGIQTVNGMADMFVYLKVPAGATKTTTQIVASNARTATAGDFVV